MSNRPIYNKSAGRHRQYGPDTGKGGRPLLTLGVLRRSLTVRLDPKARDFLELQQDADEYPSLSELLNQILLRLANGESLDHLKRPKP